MDQDQNLSNYHREEKVGKPRSFRLYDWSAIAILVALYFFLPNGLECAWRFYLWVFDCHFHPYSNHMDGVIDAEHNAWWATLICFATSVYALKARSWISRPHWVIFGLMLLGAITFSLMVKVHGIVSYEEFVAHGV